MKKGYLLFAIIIIAILSFSNVRLEKDCEEVKSDADNAYDYLQKAYNEEDLSDAQDYARNAMYAADDAESEAGDDDCDCNDAAYEASTTYDYARKAYNADRLDDLHYYAHKGMNETDDITSAADDCEDE